MKNEEFMESLRDLASQHFALQAAVTALMQTHPNPQLIRHCLDQQEQAGLANLLNLTWSDEQVAMYQRTVGFLRSNLPPASS